MLKAYFHNDSNDKPHIHVWDTEGELDVCPPMYSKQEVHEWVRKTETFDIFWCSMVGLPKN